MTDRRDWEDRLFDAAGGWVEIAAVGVLVACVLVLLPLAGLAWVVGKWRGK